MDVAMGWPFALQRVGQAPQASVGGSGKAAGARCYLKCDERRALTERFKAPPRYRGRLESDPVPSLVTLLLLAMRCDAQRGKRDMAKPARWNRGA